ncbi:MAG: hypothetical protein LAT57_12610, partial [Balneolales bacterium]|nr:hypothetical protein [Balneolales bacterium]
MASKIYNVFHLIERGYYRVLFNELRARLYSHTLSYGLRRDLETRFEAPPAKIKMHIRELTQTDVTQLLDPVNNPETNPRILANQLSMVEANLPTCYVAVTVNDKPRYMQWLIGSDHNRIIKKFFKGVFPALDKSEALLEGAYSHPGYRGLRIMPMAMALIAEKAEDINARWVITFVNMSNIASLKGCHRSGFEPYLIRDTR